MFHLPIYYKVSYTYQNNAEHYQLSNTVSISLKSLNNSYRLRCDFVKVALRHFVALLRTPSHLVISRRISSRPVEFISESTGSVFSFITHFIL
jgi:hypothetical protein